MVHQPTRQLTLFDTTCIIVGVIVGAGLYQTAPTVADGSGSVTGTMAVWIFCGMIGLVSALCYAELSTSFPRSGGDYVYLREAYHPRLGNLFAWCEFWIIRPGNIGMMAFVFANYIGNVWPLGLTTVFGISDDVKLDSIAYASASLIALTLVNLAGVRTGKTTQNVLTVLKVFGLLCISAILFTLTRAPAAAPAELVASSPSRESVQFAILMAMFAYGGCADMVNVAAEVKQPRKNLLRSLVLGSLAVMLIYLCANAAFFHALGYKGVSSSDAVAIDAMELWSPGWGGQIVSLLVGISCLGTVNATLMTGSRIFYAVGASNPSLKTLGGWSLRFDAPVASLLAQCAMTLALIIGLGWSSNGFEQLLIFTTPVYWAFALLVAIGLFRLRNRTPDEKAPFRTPMYPLIPILFALLCAFMLYSGISWAIENRAYTIAALSSLTVVAFGVVFALLLPNRAHTVTADIIDKFERRGQRHYGENVSELKHALQTATFASQHGEPPELVLACLLHDYGHLLHDLGEDIAEQGTDTRHEELGADALAGIFSPEVVEPIRLHAAAKRYLCWKHETYQDGLSGASKLSLSLQGGPMGDEEAEQFESHPHFDAAIRLRRYDDMGKVPEMETPELESFRDLIASFVQPGQ